MPIKTGPLSVFVLAFLAPQEAHLEPPVLNAAAGDEKGNMDTALELLPTEEA